MRTIGIGSALVAIVLAFAASAATAPSNDDELLKDEQHFLAQSKKTYTGGQKAAKVRNMEVVGRNDLGGRGFNFLNTHPAAHLAGKIVRPLSGP